MKDLAEKIYKMTAALKLTGQPDMAEQEIDAYALLMDKREPLVKELISLTQSKGAVDKEDKQITDQIMKKIVALDKEHIRVMEHIRGSVMGSMKEVRSSMKLNNAYAHPMDTRSSGVLDASK